MKTLGKFAVASLMAFGAVGAAQAQTTIASNSFNVTASVVASCAITTQPSDVAFGIYDPTAGSPLDRQSAAAMAVRCTNGTAYTLALVSAGAWQMASGSNKLPYKLFAETGRTTDLTAAGAKISVTGTGLSQAQAFYGRIAIGQNVPAGNYADTVTVNVAY